MDASRLRIALEEGDQWRRTMSVTVPAEIVDQERRKAMATLAQRIKLPGFRKGKIPEGVVEQRYGAALRQETLDRLIGEAYREALQLESVRPISEGEVEEVDYQPDQDLRFSISFDVEPEIVLGRLGGFTVRRPASGVGDEEVDKVLERLREQNGTWRPVEEGTPEEGNQVSVKIRRLEEEGEAGEAKAYEFVLGDGDALPDIEESIRTLSVGEEGRFTVGFPDDFPDEERRGETQELEIELVSRKELELPELTDDFASRLGDFQGLEELRDRVREDLRRESEDQVEAAVRGQLLDQILEANAFDVPRSMLDRYMAQMLGDTEGIPEDKMAEIRTSLEAQARRAVKRILLIGNIADTQGLRATEDEVDARVEEIAEKNDTSPAEVYARLQKAGRIEAIEGEITERKVFDFLKEQSEIVPTP